MRHQAEDVARGVANPRDAVGRPVGVRTGVPEHDLPGGLQVGQRARVGGIAALAALQRHHDLLAAGVGPRPRRPRVFHPQPQVPGDEAEAGVAGQRPRQQVRLAQDLEPVADAQHRQARPGRRDQFAHHRGEPGDRAAAQVVAVGEPAGQDDRGDAAQIPVGVPQRDRLRPGEPDGSRGVTVIQRPREGDDPNPHAGSLPGRALAGGPVMPQRGILRPPDVLAQGHDRAASRAAVQGDVVHAGPHDGQAPARLGQLSDRGLRPGRGR